MSNHYEHSVPPDSLTDAKVIVDLGCHKGEVSEILLDRYEEAHVLSVEMVSEYANIAKARLKKFGERSRVINAAIGYPAREAAAVERQQQSSLVKGAGTIVITLDTLLNCVSLGDQTIDFMKMDIEGEELNVLSGGGEWVQRTTHLLVEVHKNPVSVAQWMLENLGYKVVPRLKDPEWSNHLWCTLDKPT